MILKQLSAFFTLEGYTPATTNNDDFMIFLKQETGHVTVLLASYVRAGTPYDEGRFTILRNSAANTLREKNSSEMHLFSVVFADEPQVALAATANDRFSWVVDVKNRALLISPGKAEDFYGLKGQLTAFLQDPDKARLLLEDMQKSLEQVAQATQKKEMARTKTMVPWVTIVIIALNLLMGLLSIVFGESFVNALDLDPVAVFEHHQWYRIFTYMYLHADVSHYLNNMVMLYVQGNLLEVPMGRWRYALIYHILGMLAGLGSLAFKVYSGSLIPSIGASGAIMGLTGVLIFVSLRNLQNIRRGLVSRIIILMLGVFYSVYQGFYTPGVDNAAHIAGIFAGIITGFIWDLVIRRRVQK